MYKIRNYLKYILLLCVFVITYFLWAYTKIVIEKDFYPEDFLIYISQLSALTAVILFAVNFIMATRLYFVEALFNGLDKMYKYHKVVARIAFTLAWIHPILLTVNYFAGINTLKMYFIPGQRLASNAGMLTLYVMTILVLFSVAKFLPYHLWKHTHRLMILVLLFLGVHMAVNTGTIASNPIFKFWMMTWVFIGIVCWIYIEFFYKKIGPVFYYKVSKVNSLDSITELYLEPQNKPLVHKAGQFTFMSFLTNKLIGNEAHPYTISSNPHDYNIRISAKSLGDYSSKLYNAKQGDLVRLIGPYGYFTKDRLENSKKQIWIAGGIGVTPFLSMVAEEKDEPSGNNIHFFYTTKTDDEGVYRKEIESNADTVKNLSIHFNADSKDGYLTATKIAEIVKDDIKEYSILLCGPKSMMHSLKNQFKELGLSNEQIIFEDFALKPA